jgi:hypothetical protein
MKEQIEYYYNNIIYVKTLRKNSVFLCDGCDLSSEHKCLLETNEINMMCGMTYIYKKDMVKTRKEKLLKIFKKF